MGIKLQAKIKVKHNYKNIQKISEGLSKILPEALEDVLKNMKGYAVRLEKGHNEEGILYELVDTSNNEIKGRLYTDKVKMPYAMFEHFGTGQYAEMEHIGQTKHFIESGFTEWFIPVNKVPRPLHYPIITINAKILRIFIVYSPCNFLISVKLIDNPLICFIQHIEHIYRQPFSIYF